MKKTRGTAEWAYRCSLEGTDAAGILRPLTLGGFLWRGLHNVDGHKIANVKNIEIGDTVHVYLMEAGTERYLSSYLIETPTQLADADVPAIEAVREGELFDQLSDAGYDVDPVLGYFTGFRVRKDEYATPPQVRPRWVARNAIARVDKE